MIPAMVPRSPLWANSTVEPKARGKVATMFKKITREAPWPMPRSVITSEIHITTMEPVTRAKAVWITNTTWGTDSKA